jgi:phosphotransferase system HPr (HPr) family protein
MFELSATVRNRDGIHCRPSATIIKAVASYVGEMSIRSERGHSDLRSVIALMTLGLLPGEVVVIRVTGPDEEAMCRQLVGLFETHFDFPHRPMSTPTAPLSDIA